MAEPSKRPPAIPSRFLSLSLTLSLSLSLSLSAMGKSSPKGAAAALGKGKVTPVEIAFLVDRYLADNGYSATLASFHSEAAEIFAKTRGREVPKGLLTLADILDEYISLKEQRIAVEQEKRRVDSLLGGIQDAVNVYRSGGVSHPALPSPPQPSPPALPPTPVVAPASSGRIASANPGSRCRSGPLVQQIPVVRYSPVVVPSNVRQASAISPPLGNPTCSNKRKNSKPVLKAPAAPKKHRGQSQADVSALEGTQAPSESHGANRTEQPQHQQSPACNLPSNSDRNPDPFLERSSVANSPSLQSPDSNINSTSPKTPDQQPCSSQGQKMAPLMAGSSSCQFASGSASKELTPSNCSIISSKTVVLSPYKNECYYAVQKSCRITSSPSKPSPRRTGKRDCVKSRLDFDDSGLPSTSDQNPALAGSPNSSIDDKQEDIFDFDISDFDMDFSFAELLVNVDLDCGEFTHPCQPAIKSSADSISGSEDEAGNVCLDMNQDLPVPYLTSMSGIMSEEGMRVTDGHDSVASVKTITKCIKLVSPAKGRRNSCFGAPGTANNGITYSQ